MKRFVKDEKGVVIAPWMIITAIAVLTGIAIFTGLFGILSDKATEIGTDIGSLPSGG